jgi:AAA family ATP:ADP antiporter
MPSSFMRVLRKAVEVREEEVQALFWSCTYFFFVLSAYYILRPIRDEMGVAGGVDNLAWLYTGTLTGMLLIHPLFTSAVSKLSRMQFIALTYRFFMSNLLIFFALLWLAPEGWNIWIGRIFFIWTSVFNLFVVSVFWSFMTDIFHTRQGKRLFGFIGVGGTFGGILGSSLTAFLAVPLGPRNLMIVSVIFLEIAVLCVRNLSKLSLGWSSPAEE